ncbi:serine/threonine-protein kinase Nek5-like isoform X1 [Centruroides vittatus]|uniref:serine/threonine-protein kinase Nek5-like isoform X1 n=1 Tax=Centruroides vittatus TaxID=120091 RepID=UPI00350F22F5
MAKKYEKEKLIGTGTFGQVWLVKRKNTDKKYVMKELKLISMSPHDKQQALNEIEILSKCKHVNIIRYKEAVINQEFGLLGIVMEYAEGGDLFTRIQKQKGHNFSEETICLWFVQICLALQYIHDHNILHRDLKTQNILLTAKGRIKVGDFGIARILERRADMATTAIGTPYYLSPEICQMKPYNYKTDIWSLGCVLYELCCLEHPFQGYNFHQLVVAILKGKYKPIPSGYSCLLNDLLEVMLRLDPEKRPSTDEILAIPTLQTHLFNYFSEQEDGVFCRPYIPKMDMQWFNPRKYVESKKLALKRRASVSVCKGESKLENHLCQEQLLIKSPKYMDEPFAFCSKHSSEIKNENWSRATYVISKNNKSVCLSKGRCPHSVRCQECVLETLWSHRLRKNANCTDNLRDYLDATFGREEVDKLKERLIHKWNEESISLHFLLPSVRQDLVHYIPLLIQLVQLENFTNPV